MTIKASIKRDAVLLYFVLTFLLSWGSILAITGPNGLPIYMPAIVTTNEPGTMLLTSIATGLLVAFLEELGWTGFVTPRLRRYSIFATALMVGLVWGAWHFPPFWAADTFDGTFPLLLLLARLFSWLLAYRVLMVWVYDHTESLLLVMLMHASLVAAQFTLFPMALAGMTALIAILTWAVVLWIAVAAVAIINRGQITRPRYQPIHVVSNR